MSFTAIDAALLSGIFVGSGTLAISCAQLAMETGHDIRAVLCGDAIFANWAARANIPCMASVEELSSFLKTEPAEWLFSVVNPFILPVDVLERISQGVFNYHDGPLPRYAGTHATSWALLAQETEHAITWHLVDDGVNLGDIAVQRQVLVTPADTALTLNLKCYEAAIEGFRELLACLAAGKLSTRRQALEDRSYFPRRRRPDATGILRWDRSAQDLSAMARALDFGPNHPNPLCLCKALVGEEVVAIRRLEVLPRRSGFAAGRLVEMNPSHWRVATATQDVDVWFGSLDGQPLEAQALASRNDLVEGDALAGLSDDQVRRLTAIHEEIAPSEDFWRQRLEQFKIVEPPFLSSATPEAPARWQSSSWLNSGALAELSAIDRVEYLVTVWLIYLARITGQTELQLAWTPAPKASRAGVQSVEAVIASTVPMEVTIDFADGFQEIREAVAAECAQLRQRDSFARDLIGRCPPLREVEALRSQRPWPIGVAIAAENSSGHSASNSPGELLTFEVCALDGSFRWHFDASRLAPERVERMTQHLQALLCGVLADAGQPVGRIELLSAAERGYLLEELNRTEADYPSQLCIHEVFEAQVREAPDRVAVVHGADELSYGELNERANRLAHHLIGLGVEPGDRIATLLDRSVTLVVAQLAILKAGAVYVPIDRALPCARQEWLLADCAARLVLGESNDVHLVEVTIPVVLIEPLAADAELGTDPGLTLSAGDAAYVMYTSGSTGLVKGVVVPHRAVNRLVINNGYVTIDAGDRVAWAGNPAFDASTFEVWAPLLNGGCIVVMSATTVLDAASFSKTLEHHEVTSLFLTTALFNEYTSSIAPTLAQLKYLLCGGERSDPSAFLRLLREEGPVRLIHCYGPTETTTFAATYSVGAIQEKALRVPIGRPIANTRVYLLDGDGAPVPLGAVGELYIGGTGVAHGYLNRPELTAERFLADPFSGEADARMYRTGDLARYLPDGNIEFLGRNDDQVKIRGFRIEPGEIAARLVEHDAVRDAVVVAREDRAGQMRLVAYVVYARQDADEAANEGEAGPGGEDPGALAAALRAHLGARLPDYMVPSAFVRLDVLPLTANGKLDRKALPAPADDAYARRSYEAPRGEIETALAGIWAELLGLERVGRHDHFFELGGHSLLAVQLMERLRRLSLGVEVRTLFARPVLCDLAASLGSHREVAVPANLIDERTSAITPAMLPLVELSQEEIDRVMATVPGGIANIQDIYGLSPLQDGILFHHLLTGRGDPYLLVSQRAFAGRALLDRYLGAVQQVVDRHDMLRTAFVWEGLSSPVQVVWRNAPLEIAEVELDEDGGPGHEQLKRRFDPRHYRIDLGRAPLLRFVTAREPGTGRWLLLELHHHLIGDHTASEVMRGEVRAVLEGRAHELGTPQPFRNLVAQARLGVDATTHEAFFRAMLGDIGEPSLPFGLSEVHGDGSGVGEAHRMLPQGLNDRLRAQARRLGVSLASLCHLAWGQVVAQSSGREQAVFGTVLFGRMHAGAGADRALGLFMNTLPVRLDLDGTGVEASVRTTHARLAELLANEHASLALAQRCSGVAAPAPLFSALMNYRHNSTPATADGAEDVLAGVEWLGEEEHTNYPLTLSVEDFGEALGLTAQIAEPISPDRICGYMQRALEQLVEALEQAPNRPVRQLDILPAAERRYLLEELNRTEADYPSQLCIHELFEAQVREAPDRVAVVHEDEELSYGALNERANRLAHHLIGLGVKPDQPVAICLERSPAMVVGVLAILKAGGAYVPLDPAYPSARLTQVLDDAAPQLMLCDAAGRQALGADALGQVGVVDLDTPAPAWAGQPASDPDPRALGLTANHLAYIIYTSGSTGTPKGVMVEHRSTANLLHWNSGAFARSETSRVLFSTSISFDLSVYECFGALSQGATLCLAENALALAQTPSAVSLINTVPSAITALLEKKAVPASASAINLAGERLSAGLIERIFDNTRVQKICNLYAPSETTTYSTWVCIARGEAVVETIGRPISNTRIYLLDAHGQPVPFGAVGELYIGGAGVARGYLNRPELTAE
ncbi:amino acid adenylation domain-containing protein, partial [Bradyrhizobium sp. BRP14]|nr:amino acid adenylation domain-containing protein [Bradyrhizobium sp. BRP14]